MNINDVEIKDKFKERYEKLTDWDKFIDTSLKFLKRSVRINTLKISVEECKRSLEKNWILRQVPWCKEGFWMEHKQGRRDIGNTLEHQLGYIYVQESMSMIPPIVLDVEPGQKVLDMCASPGSKASQIAMYMENKGVLIANDYKGMRLKPLGMNLQRCGVSNEIVTLMSGHQFKLEFDRVLVDAPCSGTGTIRKSLKTLRIWNPGMIKRLSATQKKLIEVGFNNLKKGGILVYSTCTLEPEEDEEVIDYLLEKYDNAELMDIKLNGLNKSEAILEFDGKKYNPEIKKCLRIWPQDNDEEGFFIVKIKKK